jgi:hypothetical protein
MTAQILLTATGAKHLVAKALTEYIDFTKKVYIAYGTTNQYLLYHLGIKTDMLYAAGCNVNGKFNITRERDKPVVLENGKLTDIAGFEMNARSVLVKGANALWYENGKKHAAVAAADPAGGTYGNFYIKAVCAGAQVIIPVTHEKLIPYFVETSQNVDSSTGAKIAMLRFFSGEVFSEIEAFKILFGLEAEVILAGGIDDCSGAVGFLLKGGNVNDALEFAAKYNTVYPEKEKSFIY